MRAAAEEGVEGVGRWSRGVEGVDGFVGGEGGGEVFVEDVGFDDGVESRYRGWGVGFCALGEDG